MSGNRGALTAAPTATVDRDTGPDEQPRPDRTGEPSLRFARSAAARAVLGGRVD